MIDLVSQVHSFPRGHYDSDFDPANDGYYNGLVFVGVLVVASGILMICGYITLIGCRFNGHCHVEEKELIESNHFCGTESQSWSCMLFSWLATTGLLVSLCYLAREELHSGLCRIDKKMDDISMVFSDLEEYEAALEYQSKTLEGYVESGYLDDCIFFEDFESMSATFLEAVDEMASSWNGLGSEFDKIGNYLEETNLLYYLDSGIATVFGVVMGVVISGLLGLIWPQCLCLLDCMGCMGVFVVLLLCLLCGMEFMILVGTADFCVRIDSSVLLTMSSVLDVKGENLDLVSYFVRCAGVNPIMDSYGKCQTTIIHYQNVTEQASKSQSCDFNIMETMTEVLSQSNTTLVSLKDTVDCGHANSIYQAAAYGALCDDIVHGLCILTGILIVTVIMLFLGLLIAVFVREKLALENNSASGKPQTTKFSRKSATTFFVGIVNQGQTDIYRRISRTGDFILHAPVEVSRRLSHVHLPRRTA